ncbi:unnamed protein product [Lasius platythorax]|uniref:Uncharacterized protein n=1 Tax=Lasius platythorax TaxID=488582 RepID=A0AAV2PBI3_9HYME
MTAGSNKFTSVVGWRLVTGLPYQAEPTSRRAKVFRTSPSRTRRLTWPRNRAGTAGGINDLGARAPLMATDLRKKVSALRAFSVDEDEDEDEDDDDDDDDADDD